MPSFNDYIVFVDESGDHGMESIDPHYPLFVLAFCLFKKDVYAEQIAPAIIKFKFAYFGHDQVILHERDIRRAKGPFNILQNKDRREPFFDDLNRLIENCPFLLVGSVIRKEIFRRQYAIPDNPYHIGMGFGLERIYLELYGRGCRNGITYILFESRGKKEDNELELEFRRICATNATGNRLPFEIIMADKKCNSGGLQLADLIARPIGRKVLKPEQDNRAYDILKEKFRRSPQGKLKGWGLKWFPP